jgi:glycosyltransferase involved in cell wall biosynthesis
MSCGVPIAGYGNEAFLGVRDAADSGWAVTVGRINELADAVSQLHSRRNDIVEHSSRALEFAVQNCFENTFERRVDHLIGLSRLPAEP